MENIPWVTLQGTKKENGVPVPRRVKLDWEMETWQQVTTRGIGNFSSEKLTVLQLIGKRVTFIDIKF
jgi:hypothetical protein